MTQGSESPLAVLVWTYDADRVTASFRALGRQMRLTAASLQRVLALPYVCQRCGTLHRRRRLGSRRPAPHCSRCAQVLAARPPWKVAR